MEDTRRLRAEARLARQVVGQAQLTPRRISVPLSDITVGLTTVPVTWTPPISGGYTAVVTVIGAAADLPKLAVGVKVGSKTPSGCDVLVVNTAALPVSAAGLDIIIVPASS